MCLVNTHTHTHAPFSSLSGVKAWSSETSQLAISARNLGNPGCVTAEIPLLQNKKGLLHLEVQKSLLGAWKMQGLDPALLPGGRGPHLPPMACHQSYKWIPVS